MDTALELADANKLTMPLMHRVKDLAVNIKADDLRALFK